MKVTIVNKIYLGIAVLAAVLIALAVFVETNIGASGEGLGHVSKQTGFQSMINKRILDHFKWADALAVEIKRAQAAGDPDTGETYYQHWLAALEQLVAQKGVATREALTRYRDAWDHACERTPHGRLIELKADDFR